jgi:exonuclease SbcD
MRALHTADWHIGQTLNGWSREAEHALFLSRLADVLEDEAIDLLLVAGDVFDSSNPSGESQRLLYRALAAFKRRRPGLVTVISGGNHDPALRLEAPSDLFASLDIHAIGTVRRNGAAVDVGAHLVPVRGPDGQVAVLVLAIPFLRAGDLPGLGLGSGDDPGIAAAVRAFHDGLVAEAEVIAGDLPLIATGHLHCAGGLESEGAERSILIGGSHAVPPDVFPPRLDYVALGHLHGPQALDGGRVRYAGSAFPLSASELRHRHGVTILDIGGPGAGGRRITARHHPIPWPAPVLRLPATGTLALDALPQALAAPLAGLPEVSDPDLRPLVYVELAAGTDAPAITLSRAEALLRAAPVRTAGLRIHRDLPEAAPEAAGGPSLQDIRPEDLFVRAFTRRHGIAPGDRHLAAFRDVAGAG